jgi:glycosyltransferase involved in cell wall biosynthesis
VDSGQFQHTVVTLMGEDSETGKQYGSMRDHYRRARVQVINLGERSWGEAPAEPRCKLLVFKEKVQKLKAFIHENRVDILDVHLAPGNPTGAIAALSAGIPFVVTLYQLPTKHSMKLWLGGQFNLGTAALLITDSQMQASQIRKWLLPRSNIRVIPNGTPPPKSLLPRNQVLRFFDIPDEPGLTIIGQVSGLISYKGHAILLEAAQQVLAKHPECWFLLVGYDRHELGRREVLLRRAAELGIAGRVRIAGYPGSIGDVWNIIDIHLHASLLDSLPNALLEAMSLAKPSVVTSVGGIPEAITHGVNGLIVPPHNPDDLARELLLLLGEPALAIRLGKAAHATYLQHFQPEIMTKRLEECFSSLVLG